MARDPPRTVQDAVYKLQLALLDGIQNQKQLFTAGNLLSQVDYEDVVTERSFTNLCGYPLCQKPLPPDYARKGRYRIALKEHKVYDLQETRKFCCSECLINSRAFSASLKSERCSDFDLTNVEEVLKLFGNLSLGEKETNVGHKDQSELKIMEKTDIKDGEVSFQDWVGPANAIEGYVPSRERFPSPAKEKATRPKDAFPKMKRAPTEEEMDFVGTIIMKEQSDVSKNFIDQNKNNEADFTSKVGLTDKKKMLEKPSDQKKIGPQRRSEKEKEKDHLGENAEANKALSTVSSNVEAAEAMLCKSWSESSESSAARALVDSMESTISSKSSEANKLRDAKGENVKADVIQLKSSLKSRTLRCSVTWADEKNLDKNSGGKLCSFQESKDQFRPVELFKPSTGEDTSASLRLSSAEACAAALSEAAEAVASGESEATDAVSEAGIVIIPPDPERKEGVLDVSESVHLDMKWPKKPVLLDTDAFESEDSWHDTPPEGFSLTLSSFATMWTTLFGWMSSSSLAYVYGHDVVAEDAFSTINGREYPRKTVLSDCRSREIKETLAVCIARGLPELVTALRISTPISTLEKAMACLLDTMSFFDALPPFKRKQWHVVILLFLDALSVSRIPSLSQYMANVRTLQHKVLNAAQISVEEYELMKDILVPLGRAPEFSAQSGG